MRVAIIYPEVLDLARFKENRKEFPPFGPLYLGAVLEQHGYEAELIKARPSDQSFDLRRFDAVGFSISASATFGLLKRIRFQSQIRPDALIMVGGVHANFFPEKTLIEFAADVGCVGEGEQTILEILRTGKGGDFKAVHGTCSIVNGAPRRSPSRPLMPDIDVLPLAARHLMPAEDLVMSDRLSQTDLKLAHVMFSRGCPFPCTFCGSAHTTMQIRSGESARKELLHLKEAYGIEGFAIVDDNFVVNRKKVTEICRSIADLDLKWSALSRVDTVNAELLKEMAGAGCIEIKFGVESGSEEMLRRMGKKTTQVQIRAAVDAAVAAGINVKAFIVHGYPGENAATTGETISLLKELGQKIDRVSLFRFVPLPGTEVYRRATELGVHGTDQQAGWDGSWERYHIHHNDRHWWGSVKDFEQLQLAYAELRAFVDTTWPDRHALPGAA